MADLTGLLTGTATMCSSDEQAAITNKEEEIADHIRSGKFEDLIGKAHMVETQKLSDKAEYLCVTNQGGVTKEGSLDTLRARACAEKARLDRELANADEQDVELDGFRVACDALKGNSAYGANLLQTEHRDAAAVAEAGAGAEDDFVVKFREQRLAQMRREKQMAQHWRSIGNGKIQLLASEADFFTQVSKDRERAIVVLHRGGDLRCDEVRCPTGFMGYMAKIAAKHLETGIFRLHEEKARFLCCLVDHGGLPALFILRHGEVVCKLGKEILLDEGLTGAKLEKILKARDGLGEGMMAGAGGCGGGGDSESDGESGSDRD